MHSKRNRLEDADHLARLNALADIDASLLSVFCTRVEELG